VGYGTGEAVFVFNVLTAFDDIISAGDIRVVNNSWGSSFRLFNPDEPINQASLALYGAGCRRGLRGGQCEHGDVAQPVLRRALGDLRRQRHARPPTQHDFLGRASSSTTRSLRSFRRRTRRRSPSRAIASVLYHPSVSAPGTNIVSTATTGLPRDRASRWHGERERHEHGLAAHRGRRGL
jgi:hypothetical protein